MPTNLALVVGVTFFGVVLVTAALGWTVLARLAPERRRLHALTSAQATGVVLPEARLVQDETGEARKLSRFVPKSPKEIGRLRKRLARAGYHGWGATILYCVSEVAGPAIVVLAGILTFGTRPAVLLFVGLAALVAYMLPGLVLQRLIVLRQKQIKNGLPDAVDLLIVCVEAGSSLDQAVVKASQELEISYPALAEELRYVNTEVRAGKPRLEAFRNFADRTKVDDVRALVAMMVQTDRFGTSIAQALRTFADSARTKRRQDAEERAGKLGVKLLFPLVFCLFPSMYVVLLGPAAIKILRVLVQGQGE